MQNRQAASYAEASGTILYNMTNNYMFRYILQKNKKALKGLIAALLHLKPENILDVEIINPIESIYTHLRNILQPFLNETFTPIYDITVNLIATVFFSSLQFSLLFIPNVLCKLFRYNTKIFICVLHCIIRGIRYR